MARHFSEHYAADSTSAVAVATAALDPVKKAKPGIAHVNVKRKVVHLDFSQSTIAAAEEVRCFTLKSGDRPFQMRWSTDSTWAGSALTADIGLYTPGGAHDGAVLDIDLFASATDILATIARADVLTEAGTIEDHHRQIPLWEMLALGAGSDTTDPFLEYDVVITFKTVTTMTVQDRIFLEMDYVPAGTN